MSKQMDGAVREQTDQQTNHFSMSTRSQSTSKFPMLSSWKVGCIPRKKLRRAQSHSRIESKSTIRSFSVRQKLKLKDLYLLKMDKDTPASLK